MNRRTFLGTLPAVAAVVAIAPRAERASSLAAATELDAQDLEFIRAWERAQQARPASLSPTARIAPAGEPGVPLVVHGRMFQRDGRTAAPGIVVFAYHTDRTGIYDVPSNGPHSWRLRGWAKTGADGRFEFTTIRPGAYPGPPRSGAHPRRHPGARHRAVLDWRDPVRRRPAGDRGASGGVHRAGQFGEVRTVTVRDGVQHVDFNMRVTGESW